MGDIRCVGEDINSPVCWTKKVKLRAFSSQEEELDVYLNFYCFAINFERNGSELVKKYTENIEEGVVKSFYKLLESVDELENEFIRFYNSSEFSEEFYPFFL